MGASVMPNGNEKKKETKAISPTPFLGVFFVGLLLLGVTANYYLNKEAGADREARNRRVATELTHFR
jgi:hypothetical protein